MMDCNIEGGRSPFLDPSAAREHVAIVLRPLSTRCIPFVFSSFQHDVRLVARDCLKITGLSPDRARISYKSRFMRVFDVHRVSPCNVTPMRKA